MENCVCCLACINACPICPAVISTEDGKAIVKYPETCIRCSACAMACQLDCITFDKQNEPTH